MNKGFTIVEILVVIVIVGIISAVIITNIEGSIDDAQVAVDKIDKAHDSAAEEKCKAFGKLYMVGSRSDSLYELNTEATGKSPAKIVGTTFGGSGDNQENTPTSITSHNGKLYMVGNRRNALYVLDTEATANPAKIVGESFGGSGINQEFTPISITSHNGKLYMIGDGSNALYVLDTEATENLAKIVGVSFGSSGSNRELTPTSITSHNGKLYMIGKSSDSLYVLDTEATGKSPATIVGEGFGFRGSGQELTPTSITSHNGKLYMVGSGSDSLYVLDTEATGKSPATIVGESFGGGGDNQEYTPRSITSHNGKLYMIGSGSDALYELDTEATGNPATRIGTGFGYLGSNQERTPVSIASHCNI